MCDLPKVNPSFLTTLCAAPTNREQIKEQEIFARVPNLRETNAARKKKYQQTNESLLLTYK